MKNAIALALLLAGAGTLSAGEQYAVAIYKDRFRPPQRVLPLTLPELTDVSASWTWSDNTPPQRMDGKITAGFLSVRIERGTGATKSLTLIAAPVSMWEEVPEELLPVRKVELAKKPVTVRIPVDTSQPSRIRLTGENSGTWWIDVPPGQHQVTIPVVGGADHAIEVRAENGKALPRVKLSLIDGGAERGNFRKLSEYRTDDRGRIVVPAVPDAAETTLVFSAADRAPHVIETKPAQIPAVVTLRPGHKVMGKLTTRKGEPAADALVVIRTWISDLLPVPLNRETRTDADGNWQVAALPDGKGECEISKRGFADISLPVVFGGDTMDLGTIVLAPATFADVLVVDDRGEPVERAALASGSRILTTTDAKGHARLSMAEKQTLDIRLTAPHHRTVTTTIDAASNRETKVVLRRAFRVTGRVVDAAGTPVAGGRTRAHNGARFEMNELQPDGSFDLDLDADADYDIEFLSSKSGVAKLSVSQGAPGEIRPLGDVVAPAALTIAGRLIRESDASPVAGARIWMPRPSQQGPLMSWAFRDLLETTSAADGTFELSGVPKVPVMLRIEAASLATLHHSVTPPDGKDRIDIGDLTLTGGATVIVHLQGDGGDDVMARVDTGGMGFAFDSLRAQIVDGTARVTGVPSGPVVVSAWRKREMLCRQDIDIPAGGGDIDVNCTARKVAIIGTVKVGGRPAGTGTLLWMTPIPKDVATGFITYGSGASQQQQLFTPERSQETVEVGADGRFDGPHVLPGPWEVLWMPERGRAYPAKAIAVADTAVQEVALEYPGVAVDGIVLDVNRKPAKGADVYDLDGHAFARTRDDGTFTLAGPEAGTWRLQARLLDQASAVKQVVVEDRPERPQVELVLGAEQSDVRVAAGRGAMVFLDNGSHLELASADDSGVATFRLQPPLPTRVRAAATVSGRWTLGDWIDWNEATKAPVELKPGEAGNVVVRTKGASGPVSVTSMSGWRVDRLLQWVGAFLRLATGNDVAVTGLPPGTYTIGVSTQQRTAAVERDKSVEVQFD